MSLATIAATPDGIKALSEAELLRVIAAPVANLATESALRPFEASTALASAARTVTTQSTWITVPKWARGVVVELECTGAGAAGSIKPKIHGRRSSAAFSTRALVDDTVGLAAATGIRTIVANNQGINSTFVSQIDFDLFYPELSVIITHATADSYTYAVFYWFFP